jgi:hypothetical protein
MSDRTILVFSIDQSLNAAPNHYFWLFLIEQQKFVHPPFADPDAAIKWASANDLKIVDDWTLADLVELEDIVAANSESGTYVVCITLYRKGRPVRIDGQPANRYWIFRQDGTRIATRSTLGEALACIGLVLSVGPPHDPTTPRSESSWKSKG